MIAREDVATRGYEQLFLEQGWPEPPATILDVITERARRDGARHQFTFLDEGDGPYPEMSASELAEKTLKIAIFLARHGVGPTDVVTLLLPPDSSFLLAMLATQRAGAVPAAIYPPFSPSRLAEQAERSLGVVADSGARAVLTNRLLLPYARLLAARLPVLRQVLCLEEALAASTAEASATAVGAPPSGEDIAFLQYSSGSTGDPKGVVILHRNLMAQLWLLGLAVPALRHPQRCHGQSVVSWLPPYHDMGLIGCIFYPIFWGIPCYLASPVTFIRKPWLWLRWISRFGATQTVAPNFAYQRCAAKLRSRDLDGIDLSTLEVAWNGAEPIQPAVLRRFADRFGPYGFSPQAMFPVYGLAENTLCVTHPGPGDGALLDRIQRRSWEEEGLAQPAADGDLPGDVLELVAVGRPGAGTEVCIVDGKGDPLPERQRGEICVRGSSLMPGYHRRPPGPEWLPGGWLRTGDLGYLADGRLFVAGRLKDMIIVGGRNVFPQDIEAAVSTVAGVREGRVVAFGIEEADKGTESVVVCAEVEEGGSTDRPGDAASSPGGESNRTVLKRHIRQAVLEALGIGLSKVVLVPRGWVDKTSSGKLRRSTSRARYLAELPALAKVGQGAADE